VKPEGSIDRFAVAVVFVLLMADCWRGFSVIDKR